jgi:hypothetical protein
MMAFEIFILPDVLTYKKYNISFGTGVENMLNLY